MRIALTGTHSIGKTTLLNKLIQHFPLTPISGISRNAADTHSFKLNIAHNDEFKSDALQKYLVKKHVKLLKDGLSNKFKTEVFIEDRCLVDALAYTQLFYDRNQINKKTYLYCFKKLNWLDKYDLIIYLPLDITTHKVVQDGYRDIDKQYQIDIDRIIKNVLTMSRGSSIYTCTNTDFHKRDYEVMKIIERKLKCLKEN